MIGRVRHLHEERLFECYVAERSGEQIDQSAASHLSICDECGARYGDLARFMDGLREEAEAETEELFTAEALRVQRQHILRRIEHAGHPARVISFPARLMRRHLSSSARRIAPRWAAAAAVAGLLVGVGVGFVLDSRRHVVAPMAVAASRPARLAAPIAVVTPPPPIVDDDAFWSELEAALGGPHNQELLPFDALTPRVQEISSGPLRY